MLKQIEYWNAGVRVYLQGLGRPETHHTNHEQTGSEKAIPEVGPGYWGDERISKTAGPSIPRRQAKGKQYVAYFIVLGFCLI